MTLMAASKPVRRELYDQIAAISLEANKIPVAEALKRIENCLAAGEYLLASNACERLAATAPDNPRIVQLWSLSLARSGAAHRANVMLEKLVAGGHADEESLGLLARSYKDLWQQTGARARLLQARDTYLKAYALTHGAWSGINAATLALVSGETEQSKQLATAVLATLAPLMDEFAAENGRPTDAPGNPAYGYWDYATIGEAALILERHDLVGWAYSRAIRLSEGQLGNRASSLRNAELVLSVHGGARQMVAEYFPSPHLVVFSGHMFDMPDRQPPRFPREAEAAVYQRILAALTKWQVQIGFSAAAGGADILFLEAMKELGGETNIVLPHPPEMFFATSVGASQGADGLQRFERVLSDARQVTVLSDSIGDEVSYYFGGVVMAGLAKLRATQVCGKLRGLTVWDLAAGGVGGTGGTVSDWLRRDIPVDRISPMLGEDDLLALTLAQSFDAAETLLKTSPQKIIAMLFADAVGFSKLSEAQIPAFVERFLGGVRAVMNRQAHAPLTVNTWGDGLYFTFDSVIHANDFSLDLSELVNATRWQDYGLPPDLNLRVALHAGPAFAILDPVTQKPGFTGTHVSRAARIEPVTPPGSVYCSEAHAALVAQENNDAFHCEFVGNMPYAKNYGVFPTYSLTRRRVR